jgi:hypothetical protein
MEMARRKELSFQLGWFSTWFVWNEAKVGSFIIIPDLRMVARRELMKLGRL